MNTRFNYVKAAPGTYEAMRGLERYLRSSGLEEALVHLITLRAFQINGCAYCLDMHWKDLRALGETEQRLYSLMRGASVRTTPIANARRWRGLRPSP